MVDQARPRDPLRTYQFRLQLESPGPLLGEPSRSATTDQVVGAAAAPAVYVAGVSKISGLGVTIQPNETWEGGNNLHRYANPDRAAWDSLTLEQGLALDDTLERWARAALDFVMTGKAPTEAVKRRLYIDVWDPTLHGPPQPGAGVGGSSSTQQVRLRRYVVQNAWVSKFQAMPRLDSMSNEVGLLSIEVTHEGWFIDTTAAPTPDAGATAGSASALIA
ncbi:MAG: phage tail protein [Acetobacteraceae bacterium]|nr:phage tail protein [Pseudomonadota bacterium]